MEWALSHEPGLRLGVFVGVLALMLALEALRPRRAVTGRGLRWSANAGMVLLDTILLRVLLPVGAMGVAALAQARGWGLFNAIAAPAWLAVAVSFLGFDCLIYWQHRLFHRIPGLWRLHRVHHSDIAFDATTALRFHPVEILLSMLVKMTAVVALGAPAVAVLLFEIALNATALFNHANLKLPLSLDRVLRKVLVTPDMHRVHHSVLRSEHDRNFGFNLPWWDHLFGSYTAQPAAGHKGMTIGLAQFRDAADQRLGKLLTQPARPL